MKRIAKKRLAELRAWSMYNHPDVCGLKAASTMELLALLDAYERKPDEVAEGWIGETDSADGLVMLDRRTKSFPNDRHVRVEVFYLTKGAKR